MILDWLFGKKSKTSFRLNDWYAIDEMIKRFEAEAKSQTQASARNALIGLDSIIDKITLKAGVKGANFGERLKNLRETMPRDLYKKLWQAHIKRNELVHEAESFVAGWEITEYLKTYRATIDYFRRQR